MAPRDRDSDAFPMPSSWLDEQGEDEENEEHTVGNQEERREYIAEVRVVERERANREMARQAELQHEMRQSVTAMEQMLESQQRIEQLQRSLAYLRELHSRMVDAGVGQGSDDEDDDDDEDEDSLEEPIDHTLHTRTLLTPASNTRIPQSKPRVQTISESSDVSMKDEEQGKT